MRAPNETQAQYEERASLQKLFDDDTITRQQLERLRELNKVAISHLQFNYVKGV